MAAPKNPKPFKGEKIWREAVTRAVLRLEKGKERALDRLATTLVREALEGDISALKEIGDRLDGKSTQMIGGDEDHPLKLEVALKELQ